ncbi:hypothetical protein PHISCL_01147 [Aspergillus sclerotialis]|uniref:Uncharacterized protein n=1 Tax=Aspergillus sclerotialis TaxID=2070753 RepID=A0A3A3A480_9EURO|nr:hypothetical protein PHISCL_01147 [Aspergillus sclerotialis]
MESPFRSSIPAILSSSNESTTPPPLVRGSQSPGPQRMRQTPLRRSKTERQLIPSSSGDRSSEDRHSHHPTRSTSHSHGSDDVDASVTHQHQHRHHQLPTLDIPGLDGIGFRRPHKHKRSASTDPRLRRTMSHTTSSGGARSLMPSWSGTREKDRDADDSLLRPITHETSRSRYGSTSTGGFSSGSRKGSLLDTIELNERIGQARREPVSVEELEQVKKRRKQGEEYLRSALSSIGTLATDITRRLDYTYYNLLEKLTALTSTITSFRELSTSTSAVFSDFEREATGLDKEIRKQIGELKGFQPQIQKVESLEERMRAGKQKAEELGDRLQRMRSEIEGWEKREAEWQARVGRRLRIFWAVIACSILVLLIAVAAQKLPMFKGLDRDALSQLANYSDSFLRNSETGKPDLDADGREDRQGYPSGLAYRHATCQDNNAQFTGGQHGAFPTGQDPLRIFDEL